MLTSHVNCLEETSHHAVPHGMWHMLLLKDCGIGKIEQRRHKSRIMHRSAFHDEYYAIKSQTYIYTFMSNAYIQRLTHLGPYTIELAHNQDLTIPGAYN